MKQALHIFRKDVRCLRVEVCLLLALAAFFAWATTRMRQSGWTETVYEMAAAYAIARLIHAEAIPGDSQFWLTRPYKAGSLATAKLLFIFIFTVLPMIGAQVAILRWEGFDLVPAIPGLLCSLALLVAEALPVAALAAVTSTFVPFILVALVLAFAAFAVPGTAMYWLPKYLGSVPRSVDWVRDLFFDVSICAVSAAILLWQYRDRATVRSRNFGVIALNVIAALFLLLPGSAALAFQSWLSSEPSAAASVSVSAEKQTGLGRAVNDQVRVPLRIVAEGVPAAAEIRGDSVLVEFAWQGKSWKPSRPLGMNRHRMSESGTVFDVQIPMEASLFDENRDLPLTIRGSAYLTLFGDDVSRVISVANGFTNVQDGLQCGKAEYLNSHEALVCRAFFRWPSRLVYARDGSDESDFRNSLISYSPLPAETAVSSVDSRWGEFVHNDRVTIVTRRPLAHFRRDFALPDLRLADLENRPAH